MATASYLRPRTIDSALDALHRGGSMVLAGGTDVYPALVGRSVPSDVIDITAIAELRGVDRCDVDGRPWLRIGATTTWADLTRADLPPRCAALAEAARLVGAAQVQQAGTLAGNLCTASPAGDGLPVLAALDAEIELRSWRGERRVPIAEFVTGYRSTSLAADELLVAVWLPAPAGHWRSAFVKCATRSSLVISLAMVAVVVGRSDDDGVVSDVAVAVGACSPVARRLASVERAVLAGEHRPWNASDLTELAPIDDVRASAAYRLAVVPTLIDDALARCGVPGDG